MSPARFFIACFGVHLKKQLFSYAGNVYESTRNRLTLERAESLILLHYNLSKHNFKFSFFFNLVLLLHFK